MTLNPSATKTTTTRLELIHHPFFSHFSRVPSHFLSSSLPLACVFFPRRSRSAIQLELHCLGHPLLLDSYPFFHVALLYAKRCITRLPRMPVLAGPSLRTILVVAGCLLWVLGVRVGGATGVLTTASVVNAASSTTVPSLDNLLRCPQESSPDGIFDPLADFIFLFCNFETALDRERCMSAISAVSTVVAPGSSDPLYPVIPVFGVDLATLSADNRVLQTFRLLGLDFSTVAGIGLSLTLATSATVPNATDPTPAEVAGYNVVTITDLVVGLRSGLTVDPSTANISVFLLPLEGSVVNPCGTGGGLYTGTASADLATPLRALPNVQPLLLSNGTVYLDDTSCGFSQSEYLASDILPTAFSSAGLSAACSSANFPSNSTPDAYYFRGFSLLNSAQPLPLTSNLFSSLTGLDFSVGLLGTSVVLSNTSVTAAITCANSLNSLTRELGTVAFFVVNCGSFRFQNSLKQDALTCHQALLTVGEVVRTSQARLVVEFQVVLTPPDLTYPDLETQMVYFGNALYRTGVTGALLTFDPNGFVVGSQANRENLATLSAALGNLSSLHRAPSATGAAFAVIYGMNSTNCATNFAANGTTSFRSVCGEGTRLTCGLAYNSSFLAPSDTCGFNVTETGVAGRIPLFPIPFFASNETDPGCLDPSVTAAYSKQYVAFPGGSGWTGTTNYTLGGLGGVLTVTQVSQSPEAPGCVFSAGGAQAGVALVNCTLVAHTALVEGCGGAITTVQAANTTAPVLAMVGITSANTSAEAVGALGQLGATLLIGHNASGLAVAPAATDGSADPSANIGVILKYMRGVLGNVVIPPAAQLNLAVVVWSLELCSPVPTGGVAPAGYLYMADANATLYNQLVELKSTGVSFYLLTTGDSTPGTANQRCGFPQGRVSFQVILVGGFTNQACGSGDEYGFYSFNGAVLPRHISGFTAPSNGSGGGGENGNNNALYGLFGLLAIPVAAVVTCIIGVIVVMAMRPPRATVADMTPVTTSQSDPESKTSDRTLSTWSLDLPRARIKVS